MNSKENIKCPYHPKGQECIMCDGTGYIYIGAELKTQSGRAGGYKEPVSQGGAVAEIGTLDELLNNIRNEEFTVDNDFKEKETAKYKAGLFWVARRIIERIKEIDANHEHESFEYEYFDKY